MEMQSKMETIPAEAIELCRSMPEARRHETPAADVRIVTSRGQSIPAHSAVLAAMSPVLAGILDRPRRRGSKVIPILGVPSDAVFAFVRFLSSSRCEEEEMDEYGVHLLVLAHVYQVWQLKRACEAGLAARLTAEAVVDMLQLARQCDAPRLYLRCMQLMAKDFSAVEQTEAWRFLQENDPWLELEILQFLQESDHRVKRRRWKREQQEVYLQLNEAMDRLKHICTEGCTDIAPCDGPPPSKDRGPCSNFRTCHGLQLLIRHFTACTQNHGGGSCLRCKRMWQLFRLHSCICDQPEPCKVPLCTQFKARMEKMEGKGEDGKWEMLVRKVAAARVISTLAKRERRDDRVPEC